MPNKWTFQMKKLRTFILKYIPEGKILVPFAGLYRFIEKNNREYIYNDLNPDIKADFNLHGYELSKEFKDKSFDCIIADPPYSHYQGKVSYSGYKVQRITDWRKTAFRLLKNNGIYIELGFNSTGLRKFLAEKIALGICCLGGSHNDILIIVQRKKLEKDIKIPKRVINKLNKLEKSKIIKLL